MKNFYFFIILLLFSSLFLTNLQAQTNDYRYQAMLLKQFMQNTDWPPTTIKNEIRVAVLGSNSVVNTLRASIKTIKGKPTKVQRISSLSESEKCHLVFIAANYSTKFYNAQKCCQSKPIVIVTEKEGLGKRGSCFNIIPNPKNPSRLAYEINYTSIKRKGLNVSQRIGSMAIEL